MAYDPVIVSAADGPLPQTVEQMKALKSQGATSVDVVLTNTELVDDAELLELVELEIRSLAEENGLAVGSITRESGSSGPYGPPS
jgi:translation elongation factor EF-Tu-like GTPase